MLCLRWSRVVASVTSSWLAARVKFHCGATAFITYVVLNTKRTEVKKLTHNSRVEHVKIFSHLVHLWRGSIVHFSQMHQDLGSHKQQEGGNKARYCQYVARQWFLPKTNDLAWVISHHNNNNVHLSTCAHYYIQSKLIHCFSLLLKYTTEFLAVAFIVKRYTVFC